MEKKLALLLGILLLLPVADFSGAALQVKANETSDSDPETLSGLGNTETSNGKLSSAVNHSEDDRVKKDREGVETGLENKAKLSGKTKSKKVLNAQKIKDGSADQENKNPHDKVVIKEVLEREENKDQVGESKRDLDNEGDRNSSQKGPERDYNTKKGIGGSGDGENKKPDESVRPREEHEKEGDKDQVEGLNGDVENSKDMSNSSRQTELENDSVGNGGSIDDKGKQNAGVGAERVSEDGNNGDGVTSDLAKKEGSSGDECYSSIRCTDQEKKMIACLRVPGNESPHLSLLIQNKGNDSITINISAPDFVHLDTTTVRIGKKENKKVEVSIGNGGTYSLINLTSGNRVCSLDFKDLIVQSSSPNFKYLNLPARRPTIAFLSFSALLIMVSAWMFLSFRRKKLLSNGYAYQKVDMGLPVSSGIKQRLKDNDGWDENWGDDWNDEEAPRTPSKPSLSLSSKRLASRRLSKETWKD